MGTPQNDTTWAGWAISSFTNKNSTASGEIQPKLSSHQVSSSSDNQPSDALSVAAGTSRPSSAAGTASTLHRQALTTTSAPVLTRTSTDQFFGEAQVEDDEVDEAWGNMDDDPFFDAPSDPKPPIPTTKFDDGGEPDFAGWLSAQAQAKSKAPLPKGLAKPSPLSNGRPVAARVTTTGAVGSGAGAKKLASTLTKPNVGVPKKIDTKPKEAATDDDWGDAWD